MNRKFRPFKAPTDDENCCPFTSRWSRVTPTVTFSDWTDQVKTGSASLPGAMKTYVSRQLGVSSSEIHAAVEGSTEVGAAVLLLPNL